MRIRTLASIIGVLAILFVVWLAMPPKTACPVTCTNDEQCGGAIETARSCKDGNVYGQGQRNVCASAGTCEASCSTSYEPWLIETCKNGCENGACV